MSVTVPRTSFVIPARDAAQTLERTLASVLAQDDGDWEALIVDDGSRDDTPRLIADHAQRDVRFIALAGSGVEGAGAARNLALHRARGRCLVFLDSDDWIDSAFLERMHAALAAAPEANVAYCDYQRVMPDGELAPAQSDPGLAMQPFATFARTCAVAIHAVLVHREWVLRAGGFDPALRTCEDWDLWQRIARLGSCWVHVAETLAFYRASDNSLSRDGDQVLADASIVIARGFGHDPRLSNALSAHVAGASQARGFTADVALAYCALWCSACDAARGRELRQLPEAIAALPRSSEHAQDIAKTLLDGVVVGLRAVPRQLAARWRDFGGRITALIDAIGVKWADAVAARRLQYTFERLLLMHDDLAAVRTLALTMALRVDMRSPPTLTPPDGVDRLYVQLCEGAQVRAVVEPGVLGTMAPRQWIELAAPRLGWREVVRIAGPAVARSIDAARLGGAFSSARDQLLRCAIRDAGWRQTWKAAARHAFVAAAQTASSKRSHVGELARLHAQAVQQSSKPAVSRAGVVPVQAETEAPALQPSAENRRAYWEHFFRETDPWDYGSAYEQEKYAFQLELLPDGPIETALELACAEGRFTERLAPRVKRLIATDISATALARAAQRCKEHGNTQFQRLDLAADPLPRELDLIVCSEVLYYLDDEAELRRVAERLAAALRPGGSLITAHALKLKDDMTSTGFDWDTPWGAKTISRVLSAVPTLAPKRSLRTALYRVERFVRQEPAGTEATPIVETRQIEAAIDHDVARHIVWGGATARRADVAASERHRCVPVLAYHRIADHGRTALATRRVGAAAFEMQMAWLRRQGYHSIGSAELAESLVRRRPFTGRPVMITFDDGHQDFADAAWPTLRRHDFNATVFAVTDLVGAAAEWDRHVGAPPSPMDASTIGRLAAEGVMFGSHLFSHRAADGLSTHELAAELMRSRAALGNWAGAAIDAYAAPFDQMDERLGLLAAQCGYRLGFSMELGAAQLDSDPMKLPRIAVRGDMSLADFAVALEACR